MKFKDAIRNLVVSVNLVLAGFANPDLFAQGGSMSFRSVEAESGTLGLF